MKSIMEQAGSIVKAIEKAWNRAGKPQDFSVKVFEHEQKNFFGMTTKPAKIGIFFEEKPVSVPSKDRRVRKKYTPTQVKQQPVRPFQNELDGHGKIRHRRSRDAEHAAGISYGPGRHDDSQAAALAGADSAAQRAPRWKVVPLYL